MYLSLQDGTSLGKGYVRRVSRIEGEGLGEALGG